MNKVFCRVFCLFFLALGCKEKTLFSKVSLKRSHINFQNTLTETEEFNYFNYIYTYMGGGVAIGDINNDGLQDVYLTGNMVPDVLYLNKGNLEFEDITKTSGISKNKDWVTGVTMGDINNDGSLDIYVCVSGAKGSDKRNLLYLNQTKNPENPKFIEVAEKYGLDDAGNSVQAVFFDYNNDGYQDLYVMNYPPPMELTVEETLHYQKHGVPLHKSSHLYKNNGDGTFSEVTQKSGLQKHGLSLGVSVGDYNDDGWQDLYISNDFSVPDYLFINNGDGTFSDKNLQAIRHNSYFGMGTDAADFNNDGILDLFQVDMMPDDNRRAKENMQSMNPKKFNLIISNNLHYQYSINTLQLGRGNDSLGVPRFSEISKMAKVSSTDWSWGGLFADFDNDGYKDLFVTNGIRREVNNQDFLRSKQNIKDFKERNFLELTQRLPSEPVANYGFKNTGNLQFKNVSKDWGITEKGFSNGFAYADLDNDGDLDLLINNIDAPATLYENTLLQEQKNNTNYLQIKFSGSEKNPLGIGAKVWLKNRKKIQFQQLTLTRGFQSSVAPVLHFGLGDKKQIDTLKVRWQNGKEQILENINTNQKIVLDIRKAKSKALSPEKPHKTLFKNITKSVQLAHRHRENFYDDYKYQVLLPHRISEHGPAVAVGDINNDGLDDFYIGGSVGFSGSLYQQQKNGSFLAVQDSLWQKHKKQEEVAACFFDANGDGFLDLYIACGGNEFQKSSASYQDRFYINKGDGSFERIAHAIPQLNTSNGLVSACDYDNDGDLDVFVAGRITVKNYPQPPRSYLLENVSTKEMVLFKDVTKEKAPVLENIGMVTKMQWIRSKEKTDLLLVGEWMSVTYLTQNEKGIFQKNTDFLDQPHKTMGWWFALQGADMDNDGDTDYLLGNLGLNYKYQASPEKPFRMYVNDYDGNGKNDLVLSYCGSQGEEYPVRGRECSSQQIPAIKVKFKDYHSFASANLKEIYATQSLLESKKYEVVSFASCYMENKGDQKYVLHRLPVLAQIANINDFLIDDFNGDGYKDVLYGGNLYGSEVETPRSDASYAGVLLGDGKGNFKALKSYQSGLMVEGEIKHIKKIKLTENKSGILIVRNNQEVLVFYNN